MPDRGKQYLEAVCHDCNQWYDVERDAWYTKRCPYCGAASVQIGARIAHTVSDQIFDQLRTERP
jgi:PHP family Zn ribbon phosphoesterase